MQEGIQDWKDRISVRRFQGENADNNEKSDASYLAPHLCYACNTTLTSRSNRSTRQTTAGEVDTRNLLVPSWVESNLSSSMSRHKMEERIRDFLLEPELGMESQDAI